MSLNCENPINLSLAPANNNCGGMGWGGDFGYLVLFLLLGGMYGYGGFGMGGFGGFGGFGGGYPTEAILQRSLDTQTIIGKLDGLTRGECDSTFALNNTITNGFNNTNMGMMQGFNGVERSFCNLSSQLSDCCCTTQRAIDGVNYNMAKNTCDLQNTMNNNTRDIIDNQNANSRAILDYLCQQEIGNLRNENQALKLAASQSNQNAALMAAMDANKAEILRRTGAECPTAAYIVQPPTPVTFPTNCCGTVNFGGNGCGNNSACGYCA